MENSSAPVPSKDRRPQEGHVRPDKGAKEALSEGKRLGGRVRGGHGGGRHGPQRAQEAVDDLYRPVRARGARARRSARAAVYWSNTSTRYDGTRGVPCCCRATHRDRGRLLCSASGRTAPLGSRPGGGSRVCRRAGRTARVLTCIFNFLIDDRERNAQT